jgi:hypothetical protein
VILIKLLLIFLWRKDFCLTTLATLTIPRKPLPLLDSSGQGAFTDP